MLHVFTSGSDPSCSGFTVGPIGGIIGAWTCFLRNVIHLAARDNYRVVVRDGDEIAIGRAKSKS